MKKTVYLTGFMGAGKSSVGRALARRLRRPFVDLDMEIERAAGATVADVFARRGESAFRRLERRALLKTARRKDLVVALGGGALLDARNRAFVKENAVLIRLSCSRRELVRRLHPVRAQRPLLAGGSLDQRVARLLRARRRAHMNAQWTVSTTRRSPAAAAALIARRLA